MVLELIKDLSNESFLRSHQNTAGKYFIEVGFNEDYDFEKRFTTLDVEDAEYLIKELVEFVNNNK
tara:strand:+ start:425 stop:619 length:195 start_codon:yes stop_codon:yes gene_type:complete